MTLDQFFAKYNGRSDIDYDGVYGVQCVDLIKFYLRDRFGLSPGAWGDAIKYYTNPVAQITAKFDVIRNNPADKNQVPKAGDIIVWSGSTPGTGGAGHIAIYRRLIPGAGFVSFDANWGGKYAHEVTHNWNNVVGWLTPKSAPPPVTGGDKPMTPQEENIAYVIVLDRPMEHGGSGRTG